jgi:hypothetical protein
VHAAKQPPAASRPASLTTRAVAPAQMPAPLTNSSRQRPSKLSWNSITDAPRYSPGSDVDFENLDGRSEDDDDVISLPRQRDAPPTPASEVATLRDLIANDAKYTLYLRRQSAYRNQTAPGPAAGDAPALEELAEIIWRAWGRLVYQGTTHFTWCDADYGVFAEELQQQGEVDWREITPPTIAMLRG